MGKQPFILSKHWRRSAGASRNPPIRNQTIRSLLALVLVVIALVVSYWLCLVWYRQAHPYLYTFGLGPTSEDQVVFALISIGAAALVSWPLKDTLMRRNTDTPQTLHSLLNERAFFDSTMGYWVSRDDASRWYWYDGEKWIRYS